MSFLDVQNVSKSFGKETVLHHIHLNIGKGEFFSLLGSSGCGKTTLMRIIAGLDTANHGQVFFKEKNITNLPAYKRPFNIMFQNYALFPHMTVEQNISYGLHQEKKPKEIIDREVKKILQQLHLTGLERRKPSQLSGGQKQRVALARCLIKKPEILLLDEPLSALDKKLRDKTQKELLDIQKESGITFIMVTHDQEEAMSMSDRIAVMNNGKIIQIGSPKEIYSHPNSKFVANFIGNMNFFEGKVYKKEGNTYQIYCDQIDYHFTTTSTKQTYDVNDQVLIAIRPEKITISKEIQNRQKESIKGKIDHIAYQGNQSLFYVKVTNKKQVIVELAHQDSNNNLAFSPSQDVSLIWDSSSVALLPC